LLCSSCAWLSAGFSPAMAVRSSSARSTATVWPRPARSSRPSGSSQGPRSRSRRNRRARRRAPARLRPRLAGRLPAAGRGHGNSIATVHWKQGIWAAEGAFEFPLVIATIVFAVTAIGPGSISLDNLFGRRMGLAELGDRGSGRRCAERARHGHARPHGAPHRTCPAARHVDAEEIDEDLLKSHRSGLQQEGKLQAIARSELGSDRRTTSKSLGRAFAGSEQLAARE
jgi:hypothetical protein